VTREEIQQRVWGTETFIDFDTGLNSAIRQIRHALKDNTGAPALSRRCRAAAIGFWRLSRKLSKAEGPRRSRSSLQTVAIPCLPPNPDVVALQVDTRRGRSRPRRLTGGRHMVRRVSSAE